MNIITHLITQTPTWCASSHLLEVADPEEPPGGHVSCEAVGSLSREHSQRTSFWPIHPRLLDRHSVLVAFVDPKQQAGRHQHQVYQLISVLHQQFSNLQIHLFYWQKLDHLIFKIFKKFDDLTICSSVDNKWELNLSTGMSTRSDGLMFFFSRIVKLFPSAACM